MGFMKFLHYILSIAFASALALPVSAQSDDAAAQSVMPSADSVAVVAGGENAAMPAGQSAAESSAAAVPDSIAPQENVILDGQKLAEQADSAYSKDNFMLSEMLYLQALKAGGSSSALFYNLGNTYYRQGNLGKAIVNYERALKLDPSNKDARQNLEFVNARIADKQIDSGSYMDSIWQGTVGAFHADTWAVIALVLFAIFLGAVAAYIFSSAVAVKKASFFGGMVVFVVTVAAVIISFAAANRMNDNNFAIILQPSVQLSTSPREARSQAEEAFLLHEGTKVEIIDSIVSPGEGMWYEVMVGHGERAWVKASEVERI